MGSDGYVNDGLSTPLTRNLSELSSLVSRQKPYETADLLREVSLCHLEFLDATFCLQIGSFLLINELLCLQLCFGAFLFTTGASLLTARALHLQFELGLLTTGAFLLAVGTCFA